MAKSQNQKLVCAQCGYENEPERVYCHNCGTKLDRSVLPRDTVTQQETLAETRRRIRKMTRPGNFGANVKTLLKIWFWAALIAAIYLISKRPGDIPTREQEIGARIISGEIDAAIDAPQSVTVQASGIDLSQHVRTRVKGASVIPFSRFKRSFVTLTDGKIRFCVEDDLFGYSIFSMIEYQPRVVDGKLVYEKTGLRIGSLGVPPQMTGLDKLFKKFETGLKHEQKLLDKAKAITITKDYAVLVTKP
jgi:zinc-ribbon domain